MKKVLALLLAAFMYVSVPCTAQAPDAPAPKQEVVVKNHENLKFAEATVFFAGSSAFQILAQHEGARECQAEDNRAGVGKLHGSGSSYGLNPPDKKEYAISGGILAGAAFTKFVLHKPHAANKILVFAGSVKYGVAGATWWMGCN